MFALPPALSTSIQIDVAGKRDSVFGSKMLLQSCMRWLHAGIQCECFSIQLFSWVFACRTRLKVRTSWVSSPLRALATLQSSCKRVFMCSKPVHVKNGHSQCNCGYAAIGQAGHEGLKRVGHMDNNTFHSALGPGNGGCGCANMALRPGLLRYNGTAQAELAAYLFCRSKSLTAASGCVTGEDSAWATCAPLRCSLREATGGAAWMPCLVPHACSTGRRTALLAVLLGALRVILLQYAGGVLQRVLSTEGESKMQHKCV